MREMYMKNEANKNLQTVKKQVSPKKFKEWNDIVGHEKIESATTSHSNDSTNVTLDKWFEFQSVVINWMVL